MGCSLGFWKTAVRNNLQVLPQGASPEEGTHVIIPGWTTGNCEACCSLHPQPCVAEQSCRVQPGLVSNSLSLPSQGCLISQSVLPGGVVSLARHVTMAAQLVTEDSGPRHLLLLQCRIPRQPLLGSTLCLGHMGVESWRGPTQSHSHIFPSEFVFCLPTSFPAG